MIGYQTRGGGYREQDEMYHALQEFTWNPSLEEDEFARLHVIRRYQRDDDALARLYGSWIKLNGYRWQLDNEADLAGWIDKNDVAAGLRSELAAFEESLSRADTGDDFVADMARDFESDRREWHAMGRPASGA